MRNDQGFTLVEVLASLVLVSILLMSFMAVFANSNRIAVNNSEKLMVINLADSYLEKLKINPVSTIGSSTSSLVWGNCTPDFPATTKCKDIVLPQPYEINEKKYNVVFKFSQSVQEENLSLVSAVVVVTSSQSKVSSKVEGYVPYE